MLADAHRCAWFVVRGCDLIARPTCGTRPGDPLADTLYGILLAPILRPVARDLQNLNAMFTPVPGRRFFSGQDDYAPVSDSAFADDTAYASILRNNDPQESYLMLAQSVATIDNHFRGRGLSPNYAPGKSSILIQTRGRNCRALSRFLLLDKAATVHIADTDKHIDIVSGYNHLGTLAASNGSIAAEIIGRGRRHANAMIPIRKALLKRNMGARHTNLYIDSLATVLLTTHCGAWDALSGPQRQRLDSCQVTSYRRATGKVWKCDGDNLSNDEVFDKAAKVPVTVTIMLARLRVFHRLTNHKAQELLALVDMSFNIGDSWFHQVMLDLQAASQMLHRKAPVTSNSIQDWIDYARSVDAKQTMEKYGWLRQAGPLVRTVSQNSSGHCRHGA